MGKKFWTLFSIMLIAAMLLAACAGGSQATEAPAAVTEAPAVEITEAPAAEATEAPAAEATEAPAAEATEAPAGEAMTIQLWTQEGEAENAFQFVQSLADAYSADHPEVTFEVINKNTEVLREDFQTASLAGSPPDLLWTVNDHAGPFTAAGLIQPVDDLFDLSQYVESGLAAVELDGQHWGVPITNGNHLMLIYNKDMVPEAPADTDAMIATAKELFVEGTDTVTGTYGLVYNQTEPFWLVPWLGGYGGKVFADDGVTPTLDTPEMVESLNFLKQLKDENAVPPESDYNVMDALFKEGNAAMIINGDWSLGAYKDLYGDKLGIAPIPMITATGEYPKPYTSGKFFMIPEGLDQAKLDVVVDFINFATNNDNQLEMVRTLSRLPALKTALEDPLITEDPILSGSAQQMTYGVPQPTVLEMRCNWDAMKPEMQSVLAGTKDAETAAADMQASAETCISQLE